MEKNIYTTFSSPNLNNNFNNRNTIITNNQIHKKTINQNKIMNTIHTLAIAAGLFGFVIFGMQAKPNQKPISTETVLILELIKQMQTQMAENQKQTNQQMAELKAEMKEIKAEQKELRAEMKELRAEMQTIKQKVDRIGFYFDMLQYVFLTILGSAVIYILALFREQIKNFIINLFTSSKKINVMNIKTITNQSSLTIIIIAIMLLISGALENAQAQTYRDRDNDGLIEIYNIEQLDSIRYNLTGICSSTCSGYELTRSLDFKSTSSYRDTTGKLSAFTKGSGWNPIGALASRAIFDGNGHTIDHLYINNANKIDDYVGVGLFANNNGTIRNVGLRNVSVAGRIYVGALVGWNNGTINQSYATGNVSGSYDYTGGLVGINQRFVSQSYAAVSVSGVHSVGGLVGWNTYDGTIIQCYATGNVLVLGPTTPSAAGGLVGVNDEFIYQCYAVGNVSGSQEHVGGLIGVHRSGSILYTYWNKDATQTEYGTLRNKNANQGVGIGSVTSTGITLSALQNPTGLATDSIRDLGPGFIYIKGRFPKILIGARITVNGVHFTQTTPTGTNIETGSVVTNITQGTSTTRATLTVDGIHFTANVIGVTNITNPYTISNIQNGLKKVQVVTFSPLNTKTYGDAPFVLSASASAGLPVLFSASNTLISINNTTVTIRGAGIVDITAYSENDTLFGFNTQILTISKGNQSIGFGVLQTRTFGNAPFVLSATSSAGLPVLFSASNTLVSINTNTVTIKGAGTVSITDYNVGNDTVAFASQAQTLTINKASQSISFESLANKTYGDVPFVLSASASAGLSLVYSASNTLISINRNTVTINGAGTVNITASNTGNTNYLGAFATQILTITEANNSNKINPTLTFTALPNLTIGQKYVLVATSNSPMPIIFSSSNTSIAMVSGNTLTSVGAGTSTITAIQDANAQYNSATAPQNVTISPTGTNTLTSREIIKTSLLIFPNPTHDFITIQYHKNQKVASVKIYDLRGREVMHYVSPLNGKLDIKNLPKGEYSIILYGEKGEVLKTEKIIKE